ncbi:hypothetical protein CDAR_195001 [Caerostris darwini]|uniref:Uncharacterized protein n=1 Tax=Caerostris darwini TaxID=1538125 RepID=A0AAV4X5L6_9ARAC|nr:hypothetical protein CDAR_195001 [Caerostris darwini]
MRFTYGNVFYALLTDAASTHTSGNKTSGMLKEKEEGDGNTRKEGKESIEVGRPHVRPVATPLKSRFADPQYHNPPQEVGSINPSRCAGNHWGSLSSGGEHYKKTTGDPRPTLPRRQRKTSLQVYPLSQTPPPSHHLRLR